MERIFPVLLLAAAALGLDDDLAVLGDVPILEVQQGGLVELGQGRGPEVEAQVYGRGHLVYVLAAGAGTANGGDLDLIQLDQVVAWSCHQYGCMQRWGILHRPRIEPCNRMIMQQAAIWVNSPCTRCAFAAACRDRRRGIT